jgi:glycerophosphoryl diester phosphodiesterase
MNNLKLVLVFLLLIGCSQSKTAIPLINAHAHNDYEHKNPLFNAIENKFNSVEVDVHLIENVLYVSHDIPVFLDTTKTLETLYLKPLQKIIEENEGNVYKDYDGFFYLMIDVKTDAAISYEKLKENILKYKSIISTTTYQNQEEKKPIKIVVTGHKGRPFAQILKEESSLMSIDGRFKELGINISSEIMPYISENYKNHLSYTGGKQDLSQEDKKTLSKMVNAVHKEGKKLRFWASLDTEEVWTFLLNHKVDLINTDSLSKFNKYMNTRNN